MAEANANIKFTADTSQALAGIKDLQRNIANLYKGMAQGAAGANAAASNFQQNLVNNINATGQFSARIATITTTAEGFTNALEKNKLSMTQYFRFAGGATKTFGRLFTSEFNTIEKVAQERVKDLQTQYVKLGRDASGAMKAIAIRPATLDLEDFGTKTAIAAQKKQIFNQLLQQGSTNLLNFGKNTQWAGRQLMVGFTIPLSIFATQSARAFQNLEKQVIQFRRVYGDLLTTPQQTERALTDMRELAKEFTALGVSVEETLGLAAKVAQMGNVGAELRAQVVEATRLSVLGAMTQEDALNTTIGLTNAFGVSVEDLTQKVNFLNAAENQTILAIQDFNEAVPRAGAVVRQLGGDVEDLAFFLTAMREGGIEATQAANALKSSLGRLINPTEAATRRLGALGINIKDIVAQNAGDLKQTVIDLAFELDRLDPLDKARAIEQLFGKFQFARMSALFQNIVDEGSQANRVLELIGMSAGDLQRLADRELGRVEESAATRFTAAVEQFRTAIAPIGEEFLKLVTPIIRGITSVIERFNNLGEGTRGFIIGFVGVLGGLGPIFLMLIGLIANFAANIAKGIGLAIRFFQRLTGSSNKLAEQTKYLNAEQLRSETIASSLQQSHQRLEQTFLGEAEALRQLAAAYRESIREMRAFTGPIVTSAGTAARPEKFAKGRKVAGYNEGVVSVPGPKGAGDIIPAMLSPGEAVIPTAMAMKYGSLINAMIDDEIPAFSEGNDVKNARQISVVSAEKIRELEAQVFSLRQLVRSGVVPTQRSASLPYGHSGDSPKHAGHFEDFAPENASQAVRSYTDILRKTEEAHGVYIPALHETTQTLVELRKNADGQIEVITRTGLTAEQIAQSLPEAGGNVRLMGTGAFYAGTSIVQDKAQNLAIENVLAPDGEPISKGLPLSLDQVIKNAERAAETLEMWAAAEPGSIPESQTRYSQQLEELVRLGEEARAIQQSANSEQEANLQFLRNQAKLALEQGYTAQGSVSPLAEAEQVLANVTKEVARLRAEGVPETELLQVEESLLKDAMFKASKVYTAAATTGEMQISRNVQGDIGAQRTRSSTPTLVGDISAIPKRGRGAGEVQGWLDQQQIAVAQEVERLSSAGFSNPEIMQALQNAGYNVVANSEEAYAQGVEQETGQAATSAKNSGKKVGLGATDGIEEAVDDAKAAGERLGEAVTSSVDESAKNLSAVPFGPPTQEQFKAQQLEELGDVAFNAKEFGERAGESARKLSDMSGKLVMSSFALTSLVGAASSVKGPIGDLAQKIMPVLTVLTGLSGVLRLVNTEMLVNFVQTRAENANLAFNTAKKAAETAQTVKNTTAKSAEAAASMRVVTAKNAEAASSAAGGAGFMATLKGLGAAARALIGPVGLTIAAVTLLAAGIFALVEAKRKEEERVRSFGEAARLSEEQLKSLANLFGVTARRSALQRGVLGTSSETDQTIDLVDQVRSMESFESDFGGVVAAISRSSDELAKMLLSSQAIRLQAAGFDETQIEAIIRAITIEAGKTDLEVNLGSLTLGEDNKEEFLESIVDLVDSANAQIEGMAEPKIIGETAGNMLFRYLGNLFKDEEDRVPIEPFRIVMPEEDRAALEAQSNTMLNVIDSLSLGLSSGEISAEEFAESFDRITASTLELGSVGSLAIDTLIDKLKENADDPSIYETIEQIEDLEDQLLALRIVSSDALQPDVARAYIDTLVAAGSAQEDDNALISEAARIRRELNGEIETGIDLRRQEREDQAAQQFADAAVTEAKETFEERQRAIQNEIEAYDALIDAGVDVATAQEMVADATLAAALAASVGTKEFGELLDIYNAFKEAEGVAISRRPQSGGGGSSGPEASFLDDITKRLRLFNNAQVSVTKGWEASMKAIMDFVDVAGNLSGEFNGLQKQLRNLGLNENLIEMITGMDPDEYEKRKNELFVFDDQGTIIGMTAKLQGLNAAINSVVIGEFISTQEQLTNSVNNQIIALNRLTAAGASYEAAYRAVQNTAFAAAIATAVSSEQIRRAAQAAMRAQRMMDRLAKINEEEERKKSISRAVQEMNKDFANQAKILDWITRNRQRLSDAQVTEILNSKDLTALILEPSIDPRALQTALDNANRRAQLELSIKKLTVEGQQEIFQEGMNKAMDAFNAQQRKIEFDLEAELKNEKDIIKQAEEELALVQFELDSYKDQLKEIEFQEEEINDLYEKRFEALDRIAEANEQISRQQQTQLDVADALSRGDIAAAARAVREAREASAEAARDQDRRRLERAQQAQIASLTSSRGLTRAQLEERSTELEKQILQIEMDRLKPAEELVRLAELRKDKEIESLQVLGKTREEWEKISNQIDLARAGNWKTVEAMQEALNIVEKLIAELGKSKPIPIPTAVASGGGGGGGGGSSRSSSPPAPAPAPAPATTSTGGSSSNRVVATMPAGHTGSGTPLLSAGKNPPPPQTNFLAAPPPPPRQTADALARQAPPPPPRPPAPPPLPARAAAAVVKAAAPAIRATATAVNNVTSAAQRAMQAAANAVLRRANGGMIIPARMAIGGIANRSLSAPPPKRMDLGGKVLGAGTSTSDSIPALLSNGEYVIKASAVRDIGVQTLDKLNNQSNRFVQEFKEGLPAFRVGGKVNAAQLRALKGGVPTPPPRPRPAPPPPPRPAPRVNTTTLAGVRKASTPPPPPPRPKPVVRQSADHLERQAKQSSAAPALTQLLSAPNTARITSGLLAEASGGRMGSADRIEQRINSVIPLVTQESARSLQQELFKFFNPISNPYWGDSYQTTPTPPRNTRTHDASGRPYSGIELAINSVRDRVLNTVTGGSWDPYSRPPVVTPYLPGVHPTWREDPSRLSPTAQNILAGTGTPALMPSQKAINSSRMFFGSFDPYFAQNKLGLFERTEQVGQNLGGWLAQTDAVEKYLAPALADTGVKGRITRSVFGALMVPGEIVGSFAKNALVASNSNESLQDRIFAGVSAVTPVSAIQGIINAFSGVSNPENMQEMMFTQAGRYVAENQLFGAIGSEGQARARVIGGMLNLLADPLAWTGLGLGVRAAGTAARFGSNVASAREFSSLAMQSISSSFNTTMARLIDQFAPTFRFGNDFASGPFPALSSSPPSFSRLGPIIDEGNLRPIGNLDILKDLPDYRPGVTQSVNFMEQTQGGGRLFVKDYSRWDELGMLPSPKSGLTYDYLGGQIGNMVGVNTPRTFLIRSSDGTIRKFGSEVVPGSSRLDSLDQIILGSPSPRDKIIEMLRGYIDYTQRTPALNAVLGNRDINPGNILWDNVNRRFAQIDFGHSNPLPNHHVAPGPGALATDVFGVADFSMYSLNRRLNNAFNEVAPFLKQSDQLAVIDEMRRLGLNPQINRSNLNPLEDVFPTTTTISDLTDAYQGIARVTSGNFLRTELAQILGVRQNNRALSSIIPDRILELINNRALAGLERPRVRIGPGDLSEFGITPTPTSLTPGAAAARLEAARNNPNAGTLSSGFLRSMANETFGRPQTIPTNSASLPFAPQAGATGRLPVSGVGVNRLSTNRISDLTGAPSTIAMIREQIAAANQIGRTIDRLLEEGRVSGALWPSDVAPIQAYKRDLMRSTRRSTGPIVSPGPEILHVTKALEDLTPQELAAVARKHNYGKQYLSPAFGPGNAQNLNPYLVRTGNQRTYIASTNPLENLLNMMGIPTARMKQMWEDVWRLGQVPNQASTADAQRLLQNLNMPQLGTLPRIIMSNRSDRAFASSMHTIFPLTSQVPTSPLMKLFTSSWADDMGPLSTFMGREPRNRMARDSFNRPAGRDFVYGHESAHIYDQLAQQTNLFTTTKIGQSPTYGIPTTSPRYSGVFGATKNAIEEASAMFYESLFHKGIRPTYSSNLSPTDLLNPNTFSDLLRFTDFPPALESFLKDYIAGPRAYQFSGPWYLDHFNQVRELERLGLGIPYNASQISDGLKFGQALQKHRVLDIKDMSPRERAQGFSRLLKEHAEVIGARSYQDKLLAMDEMIDRLFPLQNFSSGGAVYRPMGGKIPYRPMGGVIPYKMQGGMFPSLGSDTIPAMLTPGEFVVRRPAVREIGVDNLQRMNQTGKMGGDNYTYSIEVNVKSESNPEQIARTVMDQIRRVDSQRIRGNRY